MRISDWSSDVCSSDLRAQPATLPLLPRKIGGPDVNEETTANSRLCGDAVAAGEWRAGARGALPLQLVELLPARPADEVREGHRHQGDARRLRKIGKASLSARRCKSV